MPNIMSEIAIFLEPVGMGVILVYFYGFVARRETSQMVQDLSLGFVFGLAAIFAMADPIEISDGIIVDMRNLFVGIAAAFFGVRGGGIALAMAVLARIEIGGAGMIVGIVGVTTAAIMGLTWARFLRPKIRSDFIALPLLSAMISAHILACVLLPESIMIMFLTTLAPILIMLNFVCTAIFATLIYRERALLGEKNRLHNEAATDPLTRILNRRSATTAYCALKRRAPPPRGIALSCIDIDKFKAINDVYGHLAGDKVLKDIAMRMETCLRPEDIYCRMSGDEFLFVLINVTSEQARQITERCRSLISRVPVTYNQNTIDVSISLGTVWSQDLLDFEAFRNSADKVLYEAKKNGRNRIAFDIQHPTPSAA